MNPAKKYVVIICAATMLVACASTPLTPPAAEPAKPTAPVAASKPALPASTTAVSKVGVPTHLDPASLISKDRSVYFDFDDYSIKQDYAATIERQGKYLSSLPKLTIRVEGNADERGGTEYNLALGQKRAAAVVQALKAYGVKEQQLEAVSWGKEKPKALGHDEAAWAQNRRVDLSYPTK
jgi:peptidoglycan-associated lipoprotein